jgi:hypothetical protein
VQHTLAAGAQRGCFHDHFKARLKINAALHQKRLDTSVLMFIIESMVQCSKSLDSLNIAHALFIYQGDLP